MERITVKTSVQADLDKVWEFWTKPKHITNWNIPAFAFLTSITIPYTNQLLTTFDPIIELSYQIWRPQ